MKEKLELCVERLSDRDAGLRQKAFEMIKTEITEATTSMTSVPKPLKFLTPLYGKLVETYKNYTASDSFKVSGSIVLPILKPLTKKCIFITA